MPLIKDDTVSDDGAVFVADDSPLPGDGLATVTLARLLADPGALEGRNAPTGVRLAPEDDPSELAPHLGRIALIEVDFPRYVDGRGYSQAQLLRRRLGYEGELRAVGHVLRDQIFYMARCGFDSFETAREELDGVREALGRYSAVYQPAAGPMTPAYRLRHGAAR